MTEKDPMQQAEPPTSEMLDGQKQAINPNQISIEGTINWKLFVNTETKQTQILCNNSVSNEGAVLALSHQLIDDIIAHAKKNDVSSKDTQRLRIAQFELQKLFGKCLNYLIDNRDKELTQKEVQNSSIS